MLRPTTISKRRAVRARAQNTDFFSPPPARIAPGRLIRLNHGHTGYFVWHGYAEIRTLFRRIAQASAEH